MVVVGWLGYYSLFPIFLILEFLYSLFFVLVLVPLTVRVRLTRAPSFGISCRVVSYTHTDIHIYNAFFGDLLELTCLSAYIFQNSKKFRVLRMYVYKTLLSLYYWIDVVVGGVVFWSAMEFCVLLGLW